MWHRTVAKERTEAGWGSWDQVACFGNIDGGDSTKKSVDNKEGGGYKENTLKTFKWKFFLVYLWLVHSVPKVYTIYSRTCIFGTEVHKSNIQVKRWHNKYENSELDWKTQLLFKWFAYHNQVQSY